MSIKRFAELLLEAIPENADDNTLVSIKAISIRRAAEILLRQSKEYDKLWKKNKKLKSKIKRLKKKENEDLK